MFYPNLQCSGVIESPKSMYKGIILNPWKAPEKLHAVKENIKNYKVTNVSNAALQSIFVNVKRYK